MSDWWYALIFIGATAGVWGSLLWLIGRTVLGKKADDE